MCSANERAILSFKKTHAELISVPVSDGVQEVLTFLPLLIKVEQTVHQREVVRVILGIVENKK